MQEYTRNIHKYLWIFLIHAIYMFVYPHKYKGRESCSVQKQICHLYVCLLICLCVCLFVCVCVCLVGFLFPFLFVCWSGLLERTWLGLEANLLSRSSSSGIVGIYIYIYIYIFFFYFFIYIYIYIHYFPRPPRVPQGAWGP